MNKLLSNLVKLNLIVISYKYNIMIKEYTSLGLMSGTSGDGVDASVLKSDGKKQYKVLLNRFFPYNKDLKDDIFRLRDNNS